MKFILKANGELDSVEAIGALDIKAPPLLIFATSWARSSIVSILTCAR
jgi:hypothetical protein